MRNNNPLVSIIILSWNRKSEILRTLEDLKRQTQPGFEIVVVDQGSTDGTLEALVACPVRLVKLHKNLGVPGGRNVGAVNANGKILIFLDNDASLANDAVEKTIDLFEDEKIGVVGFKILIESTKCLDISSWVYQKSKLKDSEKSFFTYTFCGCGHAIRREIFEKVGYYWDDLFFSWEESELSIRVLDAGYSILYSPEIKAYHRISPENRTSNRRHECLRLRNSLWVLWKYFPVWYALQMTCLRAVVYMWKALKQHVFWMMMFTLFAALRRIRLLFRRDCKIKAKTLSLYCDLSKRDDWKIEFKTLLR